MKRATALFSATLVAVVFVLTSHQADAGRDRPVIVTGRAGQAQDLGNGGAAETKFIAITPCRIFDTRKYAGGSPLGAGNFRPVMVRGPELVSGQFAAQGGKPGGCGVPKTATSIEATISVTSPEGTGYLRAWPEGQAEPTATFMNYTNNVNLSNTGTIAICNTTCPQAADMRIKAYAAATGVVIDVQGYTIKPMSAKVNGNGTLSRGSRVVSVSRFSGQTGQYLVKFDRSIAFCDVQATLDWQSSSGEIIAGPSSSDDTEVFVATRTSANAAVDKDFYVDVTC